MNIKIYKNLIYNKYILLKKEYSSGWWYKFKSRYPNISHTIEDKMYGKSFGEKLYRLTVEDYRCPITNKYTIFRDFNSGFVRYHKSVSKQDRLDNRAKLKSKAMKKYHSKMSQEDKDNITTKVLKTKLERYGDSSYNNLDKNKQTKLKRYGDETYNNPQLISKTNLEKTNKEKKQINRLRKQTNIDTFGVEYPLQSDKIQEKVKKTMIYKYGVECGFNIPTSRNKVTKLLRTNRIGVNSSKYKDYLKQNGVKNVSEMQVIKDKISRSYLDNTYTKRIIHLPNITPLFQVEEYYGTKETIDGVLKNIYYKFQCNTCNTEFKDHVANGSDPICPICYPKTPNVSSIHQSILEFIVNDLEYTGIVKVNDRTVINPLEVDIYLPDLKLGIEINGTYYHSEVGGGKDDKYHINKTDLCSKEDISLIHIFGHEWNNPNKREIIKSIIRVKLGKVTKVVYGRKCIVKEIDNEVYKRFIDNNHLQGYCSSKIKIGLFDQKTEDLLSVMTFSRSRFDRNIEWELIRLATKTNTVVIGSFEKLFKYFIQTYKPTSIISYCDKRFFTGNIYYKLNFKYISDTKPNYYYINCNDYRKIYSRQQFMKHKLKDKLNIFDENLSEWENMKNNGYDRIWDCGNKKFIWIK